MEHPVTFRQVSPISFKAVSQRCVTGCQSLLCCVIAWSWNSRMLLMRFYELWSRPHWQRVLSIAPLLLTLSLCADPSKLTRRFIQLFSKGPHSWAYSQEGELVFQWISLSIWMPSGWNTALAKGRPWVMNSFVLCHLKDQMLEAVKTFSAKRETISFGCHR